VIELHRAEVRLIQADEVEIPLAVGSKRVQFREIEQAFVRDGSVVLPAFDSAVWWVEGEDLRAKFNDQLKSEREMRLRSVKSLVQDGLSFLDRAERILSMRRRNVWWMTWFFQRKLKVIAMTAWATVLEKGTPIPYLGLEAAPRDCPTTADYILENTQRMIRIDAYRFATVVEAYASCVKALSMRIYLEGPPIALAERQSEMIGRLASATARLRQVFADRVAGDQRKEPPVGTAGHAEWVRKQKDNALDDMAQAYIRSIIESSEQLSNDKSRRIP
jgi:hypothetical protein